MRRKQGKRHVHLSAEGDLPYRAGVRRPVQIIIAPASGATNLAHRADLGQRAEKPAARLGLTGEGRKTGVIERALAAPCKSAPGREHLPCRLPNGYKGAMAIAHLIREARERAGLTRAELARRAGVAASTVGRAEAGTRVPSTDLAERLVRAAGFEVRVALGEPDPATDALFERTLRRTPAERLADATRAARFVIHGRRALARGGDGRG